MSIFIGKSEQQNKKTGNKEYSTGPYTVIQVKCVHECSSVYMTCTYMTYRVHSTYICMINRNVPTYKEMFYLYIFLFIVHIVYNVCVVHVQYNILIKYNI